MRHSESKRWPTKGTLNLVIREKTWSSPSRVLPVLLAILICAALFSKFAVADRLARVNQAQLENARLSQSISQLRDACADFDQLSAQYHRYSYASLTPAELALADRLAVLDLLEDKVMPVAQVKDLTIGGSSLSLTLAGISLEQTASLVSGLEDSDIVESVAVYTAGYNQNQTGEDEVRMTTMTITLAPAPEGGGD